MENKNQEIINTLIYAGLCENMNTQTKIIKVIKKQKSIITILSACIMLLSVHCWLDAESISKLQKETEELKQKKGD